MPVENAPQNEPKQAVTYPSLYAKKGYEYLSQSRRYYIVQKQEKIMLRRFIACSFIALASLCALNAQELDDVRSFIRDPFGQPIMVKDQFGKLTYPIELYSDNDVVIYTPDITNGWVAWFMEPFHKTGIYPAKFYIWFKTNRLCLSRFTAKDQNNSKTKAVCDLFHYVVESYTVDPKNRTVANSSRMWMTDRAIPELGVSGAFEDNPAVIAWYKLPPRTAVAIKRLNSIALDQMAHYHGLSVQQAMRQQREVVAAMVSNAPIANTAPHIGKTEFVVPQNSDLPQTSQNCSSSNSNENPDGSGIYRVGCGVSAPVPLSHRVTIS